jgi:hypothetical protein
MINDQAVFNFMRTLFAARCSGRILSKVVGSREGLSL